ARRSVGRRATRRERRSHGVGDLGPARRLRASPTRRRVQAIPHMEAVVPSGRIALESITLLMETFENDDAAYKKWLYANLSGYVVNALRGGNPGEPILHRATCDTITPTPDKAWTGEYIKLCSERRSELETWARSHGRRLIPCCFCDP